MLVSLDSLQALKMPSTYEGAHDGLVAIIFFFLFFFSAREQTAVATGLVGCIRMLDVNNRMLNLQENGGDSLYGSGVGECGNNPCQPNPCKNGAACQVKEAEMFHCKCSKGFWGKMGASGTAGIAVELRLKWNAEISSCGYFKGFTVITSHPEILHSLFWWRSSTQDVFFFKPQSLPWQIKCRQNNMKTVRISSGDDLVARYFFHILSLFLSSSDSPVCFCPAPTNKQR